ncbi:MAG: hypothetical protein LBE82_07675, partial [Chitinophagaceae bacterium]|nr:hypothetical protein [Chitinophagaceae bacterium]
SETGLWQSLYITDIDGDGFADIVAGNYGTNSRLQVTPDNPLRIYLLDINHLAMYNPILTYSVNGNEYTFLNKDELEKELPFIKKKYLSYTAFAGKTVQDVFGEALQKSKMLDAQTMRSCWFKNNGKREFTKMELPFNMQATPVFAWQNITLGNKTNALISGGNLYGVLPYEGRYDASYGNTLLLQNSQYQWLPPATSGFCVRGEIRDIKPIRLVKHQHALAVAVNNDSIRFFTHQ